LEEAAQKKAQEIQERRAAERERARVLAEMEEAERQHREHDLKNTNVEISKVLDELLMSVPAQEKAQLLLEQREADHAPLRQKKKLLRNLRDRLAAVCSAENRSVEAPPGPEKAEELANLKLTDEDNIREDQKAAEIQELDLEYESLLSAFRELLQPSEMKQLIAEAERWDSLVSRQKRRRLKALKEKFEEVKLNAAESAAEDEHKARKREKRGSNKRRMSVELQELNQELNQLKEQAQQAKGEEKINMETLIASKDAQVNEMLDDMRG